MSSLLRKPFLSFPVMAHAAAVLLVLAVLPPPATATVTNHSSSGPCGAQGRYAPNGTYEANLGSLAVSLPEKVNLSYPYFVTEIAGHHPDRIVASAYCLWRPEVNHSSSGACVACVALAFRDALRLCPYHRDAMVERGECRVGFHDYYLMELMQHDTPEYVSEDIWFWRSTASFLQKLPLYVEFQVVGFACLLFLCLQECNAGRRDPAI